ncbi:MAG: helix-turn-helix domain-containing protein [Chloroflexi bacterium]|nr:helix-turn-helix domain-containing protein [Chloroflexota bacterium]
MKSGHRIDYKALREINPKTARLAVIKYLESSGGNISDTARVFGIERAVVYDILRKQQQGDLTDRSRAPKSFPRRTQPEVEERVIELKNQIHLGPKRLSIHLKKHCGIAVPYGTIRHILRRNKSKLTYKLKSQRTKLGKREFIDWYSAKPFEVVPVDVKYIRDQKALSKEQIVHLHGIPNYQWDALDVNSRFKRVAYSREKSWTNGLCFYRWAISYILEPMGLRRELPLQWIMGRSSVENPGLR